MSSPRIVLVTGGNRGIGFAILQALATRSPTDHYILASRSLAKGHEALSKLRSLGIQSSITLLELDVTSDISIRSAVQTMFKNNGRLDVLVNNAGIAVIPTAADKSDLRSTYNKVYDTNVSSVAVMMSLFLPLLRQSIDPAGGLMINMSSARGSLTLGTTKGFPPTVSIAYSISKTALNALTLEYAKTEDSESKKSGFEGNRAVRFMVVSPGHCKTEFNGYRGTRDPLDGAKVLVELVNERDVDKYGGLGFWGMDDGDEVPKSVPW